MSSIVLLSGGLDSFVSLAAAREEYDVKLALTFDYGQRAASDEIKASREICRRYGLLHEVIELPLLGKISNSALNKDDKELNFETLDEKSAEAVWVPNRNGLFLNIAACYADSFGYDYIIIGANKEEAGTFSDNSKEFCINADEFFKYSTNAHPKVLAPLINLEKYEIINLALKLGADLSLIKSCYNTSTTFKGHCGECESCKRLKTAILKSKNKDLIKLFF